MLDTARVLVATDAVLLEDRLDLLGPALQLFDVGGEPRAKGWLGTHRCAHGVQRLRSLPVTGVGHCVDWTAEKRTSVVIEAR